MEETTKDNRYKNGKIYRLVNSVDNEFYVGSTCLPLPKRFYLHKSMGVKKQNQRVYQHLNELGWGQVSIVLVEEFPCDSKMELERRERYWIETLQPTLNKYIPTRTFKEWKEANKEKMQEYNAKRQATIDKDKEKERLTQYRKEHPDRRREACLKYAVANREKTRQKYNDNKEAINARRREKYAQKKQQSI